MKAINLSRGSLLITLLLAVVVSLSDARPQKHLLHNRGHGYGYEHVHGHNGHQNVHTALSVPVNSTGDLPTLVSQVRVQPRETEGPSPGPFNLPRDNHAAAGSYEAYTSLVYVTVTMSRKMEQSYPLVFSTNSVLSSSRYADSISIVSSE